jgi:hypothetical protein
MSDQTPNPQIEYRALDTIKPYFNNPRNNDEAVAGLKKSISEFGFLVPIVVDADGIIVTGHTRYKASTELGLSEVPVIVASHLNEKQIQAFRIADNRLGENAKWDEGKLSEELRMLQEVGFNLDLTGFNKEELDCLCGMITASCLDEMDYESLCGVITEKASAVRGNVLISMGNYKFYVTTEAYKAWETDLLSKFAKKEEILNHLIVAVGFQPTDFYQNKKSEVQSIADADAADAANSDPVAVAEASTVDGGHDE